VIGKDRRPEDRTFFSSWGYMATGERRRGGVVGRERGGNRKSRE
jgi:hypothetical protein